MICAKQKQKIQYDRHTRPHNFRVGDKVFIKIHRLKENVDGKLRPQYRGVYTINSFLSPTNVILTDDNGRQLFRNAYINNLKKYSGRKQFNIAGDQLVQQNGLDNYLNMKKIIVIYQIRVNMRTKFHNTERKM